MIKVEYTLAKDALSKNYLAALAPNITVLKGRWPAHQAFLERLQDTHLSLLTAYVNVYEALAGYLTVLELVNNASKEELQTLIRNSTGGCISDRTASSIMKHRPFATEGAFNGLGIWHNRHNKSDYIRKDVMNHFDLDHVLPKGDCPIVALSLFNFMPSCQVCSEKLKKKKKLGSNEQ